MSSKEEVKILAIESSCDETAAAVVVNGREVRSNVISSQIALHTLYGGVVPEIASRKHIEKINQVITQALEAVSYTHLYQVILPQADTLLKCLVIFNMPFTFIKGMMNVLITFLVYKHISPIIKGAQER